jgi:2'-hydroxyisoflavone reductase
LTVKILVLGGTVFLGRHVVEAALARGHDVTLFNRGQQNPHLFPEIEKLRGDRNGDLVALRGRTFDAVVDSSGYRPEQVHRIATTLGPTGHYTFISSVSVYERFPPGKSFTEDAPLAAGIDGYGSLKARCEEALQAVLPGRVAYVRPGLIVGPHDPTDRFTYWPRRVARGGHVLAPGRPERAVQFIDVRDLADWCLRLGEYRHVGAFNAVGPRAGLTMGELLTECRVVAESDAHFIWIPDEQLTAASIRPWTKLPLWIPEGDANFGGMLLADNRRAVASGLTFRPLAETIRATLEWDRREGGAPSTSSTKITPISPERERELLTGRT